MDKKQLKSVNGTPIYPEIDIGEGTNQAYEGSKGKAITDNFNSHKSNTSNPHSVTKAQIGLSNVDNTSDANKPISTATQTALNGKASTSDIPTIEEVGF